MKARVISTYYTSSFKEGEIVEIIPNKEADAADVFNVPAGKCFLCKKEDGTLKYIIATNLQLLSSEDDPDYWERLKHQYAGMAMQGILACEEWKIAPREGVSFAGEVALQAQEIAHSLVQKLKEKEEKK